MSEREFEKRKQQAREILRDAIASVNAMGISIHLDESCRDQRIRQRLILAEADQCS